MDKIWEILMEQGVSASDITALEHTYLLLLTLPILATIISITKHLVGLKSLSLYAPIVVAFAFYEFGLSSDFELNFWAGLKYGTLVYGVVFLSSTSIYRLVKRFRMHYLPKITLVLTGVSIALILLTIILALIGRVGIIFINTFSLIMVSTTADRFVDVYARKNFNYTVFLGINTLLLGTLGYLIISWDTLRDLLLTYPYVILVVILLNVYVGRFMGLRLSEYWRFRKLLIQEESKKNE